MEKIIAVAMAALVSAVIWYLKHQTKSQTERDKKRDAQQVKREEKHDEQQAKKEEKHDKQQDEDRKFHKDIIMNHLKDIHDISTKNSKLNSQSVVLQENMIKHMEEHNNYCVETSKKIIESFDAVCDKINGRNSKKVGEKNGQK